MLIQLCDLGTLHNLSEPLYSFYCACTNSLPSTFHGYPALLTAGSAWSPSSAAPRSKIFPLVPESLEDLKMKSSLE